MRLCNKLSCNVLILLCLVAQGVAGLGVLLLNTANERLAVAVYAVKSFINRADRDDSRSKILHRAKKKLCA